ncbi:MAG: protein adenylyltransferase SelO [Anaerovoracaceae bacterium]|jgi:uncharacterized protein YdiU (UPF0061 family)
MNMSMDKESLMGWNFENSYAGLPGIFYKRQNPVPVSSPSLAILNRPLAEHLGLDADILEREEGINIFAGNMIPKGAIPISQAYGGHQFGHFTMLGDGRAVLLGEHIAPGGSPYDIQLKGSGRTPFSRGGDGRAALGPMLREYIISEALYNLRIPTSRSLAVVKTGEKVVREKILDGAVLTRVASSHIRVGTFQFAATYGNIDELRTLAEYTIERHFPKISGEENKFLLLLREVVLRQAELIVKWQTVGFIHGVMNTDNMTISGESIDFGPCAFMDTYDPKTVFSSIDTYGRYAYGNQPDMAAWNLARFAESLLPLIHRNPEVGVEMAREEVLQFFRVYEALWLQGMKSKLGILDDKREDKDLIEELLGLMLKHKADFTNTFADLTTERFRETELFDGNEFAQWKIRWKKRLNEQKATLIESKQLMRKNNPSVIPRNHRVEEALDAAVNKGDFTVMEKLLNVLSNPYAYSTKQEDYSALPPVSSTVYRTFCGT